jgi:hypothetical protein
MNSDPTQTLRLIKTRIINASANLMLVYRPLRALELRYVNKTHKVHPQLYHQARGLAAVAINDLSNDAFSNYLESTDSVHTPSTVLETN